MKRIAGAITLLLCACSPAPLPPGPPTADLDSAAITRGVIRDPGSLLSTGLYAREGDRMCIVERDDGNRIGAFIDYGDGIGCVGQGRMTRNDNSLSINLGGGCVFAASFDGDAVRFPGAIPKPCQRLCRGRASFAGLDLQWLSGSRSEAEALRDRTGRPLCR